MMCAPKLVYNSNKKTTDWINAILQDLKRLTLTVANSLEKVKQEIINFVKSQLRIIWTCPSEGFEPSEGFLSTAMFIKIKKPTEKQA